MLSSLYANSQRNTKKQSKPYTYLDFSFYKPKEAGEKPEGYNGAAYLELVRRKLLPSWALFCYKDMAAHAASGYVPGEPALIAEDAVLLHPEPQQGGGYTGMLIALESAGDQERVFMSTKGVEVKLRVPFVETKVIAREDEVLIP